MIIMEMISCKYYCCRAFAKKQQMNMGILQLFYRSKQKIEVFITGKYFFVKAENVYCSILEECFYEFTGCMALKAKKKFY